MIVIFAGCDCTGKSTYASMMDKSIWQLRKGSANSDPGAAITILKSDMIEYDNVLYDRIPLIDDIVYSQVFSKKDSVLVSHKDQIHNLLSQCCVIYFICENQVILDRLRKRGDEYITDDQIPEIKNEYRKTFELLDIHPHIIDTTYGSEEKIFKEIMEVINNESKNC